MRYPTCVLVSLEFRLHQRLHREQHGAVNVVEKVQRGQQDQRGPGIEFALGHLGEEYNMQPFQSAELGNFASEILAPLRMTGASRARPSGHNDRRDSASGTEISLHLSPHRFCPAHHIFQHAIDDVLLKDPQVAIGLQIFLQGLQLQAMLVRHVADGDGAEIRQAGLGADRGELGIVNDDFVSGKLVRPGFDRGKIVVESGLRRGPRYSVAFGIALL